MDWKILGLNKYEGAVYDALVKLGKGTATRVVKTSGVPYGRVYDVLDSLIAKNMLRIIPGKPRTYSIADPAVIEREIEKKEKSFQEIKQHIKELKYIYESAPEEAIFVSTGKRAWYEAVREVTELPKKFSYKIKYTSEYAPWIKSAKDELKKGIDARTLTRYDDETKEDVDKWLKQIKTIKKYENNGVAIWIGDSFVLTALIKSNATLLIRDNAFTTMMKQLFEDAYKNAEEIRPK
jgi:sugar-specific transcriptional regulator TrmB